MLNNSVVGRKLEFLKRVGPTYGYGCFPPGPIDLWRSREFPKLISPVIVNEHRATTKHVKINDKCTPKNEEKEVYLDYAGAALVSQSQLKNIFSSMASGPMSLLGNPHSSNSGPASSRASLLVEQARYYLYIWCNRGTKNFSDFFPLERLYEYKNRANRFIYRPR